MDESNEKHVQIENLPRTKTTVHAIKNDRANFFPLFVLPFRISEKIFINSTKTAL